MNKVFRPLGTLFVVGGIAAALSAAAISEARLTGLILAVTFVPMGVLFLWMHGFMGDLKSPGLRGGMRQMAADTRQAADFMKSQAPDNAARLRDVGRPGQATVVAVRTTGMEINFTPMAAVDLLVAVNGGPSYPVTQTMPLHSVAGLGVVKGGRVAVLVDPDDPSSILIEGPAPA